MEVHPQFVFEPFRAEAISLIGSLLPTAPLGCNSVTNSFGGAIPHSEQLTAAWEAPYWAANVDRLRNIKASCDLWRLHLRAWRDDRRADDIAVQQNSTWRAE